MTLNREETYTSLTSALRYILGQWARNSLHTCKPGIVEGYNTETKRARVKSALRIVLAGEDPGVDGEALEGAVSVDVPVLFPSGGGHTLVFPLAAGDPVMLLFSERGLTEFKKTYALATPDKARFFSEADAVACSLLQ